MTCSYKTKLTASSASHALLFWSPASATSPTSSTCSARRFGTSSSACRASCSLAATPANTAGAHISDSEECDPSATSSRSVQQLLASYAADDPFWGGQDHKDDYSVDTEDSAQDLVGFHANANEDCEEDKDVLALEEEARLMALDQQRLEALLGPDTPVDGSEDLDEETARVIAVEWINTADPDDKSDLLQNMDDLDVAVLITSNLDGDLEGKIPTVSDFRIGQHQN